MNWHTNNQKQQVALRRELQSKKYLTILQQLQQNAPFFLSFSTWEEVVAYMRKGASDGPNKDTVIRAILSSHQSDRNPCWRTILLVMFWPGLRSIRHQKYHWDTDPEELWQNLVWVFIQVICKIDIAKRPNRLANKIINDTVHRLCDIYRTKWKISGLEQSLDSDPTSSIGAKDDIDYEGIDLRLSQATETQRLQKHLDSGHISEEDFLLLVGTRVYGKSVAEYAREVGIKSDFARKRRLRAEAKLRVYKHNT